MGWRGHQCSPRQKDIGPNLPYAIIIEIRDGRNVPGEAVHTKHSVYFKNIKCDKLS